MDDNMGAWLSPARQRRARVAVNPAQVTIMRRERGVGAGLSWLEGIGPQQLCGIAVDD